MDVLRVRVQPCHINVLCVQYYVALACETLWVHNAVHVVA